MRKSLKIVNPCVILDMFNIKKIRGSPKIVDLCTTLDTFKCFNIKNWEDYLSIGLKMEMRQQSWTAQIRK